MKIPKLSYVKCKYFVYLKLLKNSNHKTDNNCFFSLSTETICNLYSNRTMSYFLNLLNRYFFLCIFLYFRYLYTYNVSNRIQKAFRKRNAKKKINYTDEINQAIQNSVACSFFLLPRSNVLLHYYSILSSTWL